MTRKYLSAAVLLTSIGAASLAHASPYRHDGVYLAGGGGLGYLSTSMTFDGSSIDNGSFRIYGAAIAGSAFFGGTLAQGLAVGGGLYGATAPSPRLRITAADLRQTAGANGALTLLMLGPFANFYPDPTSGFHVLALIGFADVSPPSANTSSSSAAGGLGFLGGAGYDWWIGPNLGLGALAGFAYAAARKDSVNYPSWMPSLSLVLTYN